jgi:hypothetical protein
MFKRVIASFLFLAGGSMTWVVLTVLQGFAASQAAMSAGPISGSRASDAAVLWLLCCYFVISAISAIMTCKKRVLWVLWVFTHALVVVALCILCSGAFGWDTAKLIPAILMVVVIAGILLSPWLTIWGWLLKKASP